MTVYWLELGVEAIGTPGEVASFAADLALALREQHKDGDSSIVTSGTTVSIGVSINTESRIDEVPAQVVGVIRAAVHGLGHGTPGWPEPVTIDDIRQIKVVEPARC